MVVDVDVDCLFTASTQTSTSEGNRRASTVNESNYNKRTLRITWLRLQYHTRNSAVARAEFALRAVVGFRAQRVASYYTGVCEIGGVDLVLGATLYRLFHAY